ncbi:hypothetical protein AGRA3207_001547 [Actinomadura graeca]|uniref:Uncharacterized protein n=1 Tax=Actinomadura graeca TaxID=2750812 RepID=A0ABX8QPV3_9ACTN|nr:hypothetical protein [Actinomadura graeca]QXJ20777.1 hypothetical protein AGRA3207_001547 [Actinomadura graeca]
MNERRPDGAPGSVRTPTHYHCYKWSGSGQEWDRLGRTDTLDVNSPDRPPQRTNDWLNKSPRLIAAVRTSAGDARDWLVAEWGRVCENALYPVPAWVDGEDRAAAALAAIESASWPTYSQWLAGGTIVLLSVVGTDQTCH